MLGCRTKDLSGNRSVVQTEERKMGGKEREETNSEPAQESSRNSSSKTRLKWSGTKIAAAYARVSSDKQEKEETISSQIEGLCRTAEDRSYELPKEFIFTDDGYSGAKLDRPALDRLRDLASAGAFEVVLLHSPDRLARNYAHQVVILEELKRAGCEVIFLNRAFNESPQEQMLLQMQGVFAEYERALIHERTRRGRIFAAKQGRVNWGGNSPYGFKIIRRTDTMPQQILVDLNEATIVRQMYRWLVEEELSSYAIQNRLAEKAIPTRKENTRGWCQSTVIGILRNSIYKGETYYNRTQAVDVKQAKGDAGYKRLRPGNLNGRGERPKEEWIKIAVPAILDPELWQMAQEQLARNRERAKRNNVKHHYLLSGLLICGRCHRRLIGVWNTAAKGRYICSVRYPRTTPWSCSGRTVSGAQIESAVWNYVCELLSNRDLLQSRFEAGKGDPAIDFKEEQEQERIERKLQASEREIQRLIDAYQAEAIDLLELQKRRKRIDEYGHALRARIQEIQRQQQDREHEIRLLQGANEFCQSVQEALIEPTFETKRKILRLVVDRIIIDEESVIVRHIVPTSKIRLQTEPQWYRNVR